MLDSPYMVGEPSWSPQVSQDRARNLSLGDFEDLTTSDLLSSDDVDSAKSISWTAAAAYGSLECFRVSSDLGSLP